MGRHIQRVRSHVENQVVNALSRPTTLNELMGTPQMYDVIFTVSDVKVNNMPLTEREARQWMWDAALNGSADKVRLVRKRL